MSYRYAPLFFFLATIISPQLSSATTITVRAAEGCSDLSSVTWEYKEGTPHEIAAKDGVYVFNEPEPRGVTETYGYVIVAAWKDPAGAEYQVELYLKAPAKDDLNLTVFSKHIKAADSELKRLIQAGNNFRALLMRYQLSRDLYRTMSSEDTSLRRLALKTWFDAAFELSRLYPFLGTDPEATQLAATSENQQIKAMSVQYALLHWRDADKIRSAFSNGDLESAENLNTVFINEYRSLDPETKKSVNKYYRINEDLLKNNATAIAAKQSASSSIERADDQSPASE